jgi:hypothetical protein
MKRSTKKILGGVALVAGSLGAFGALLIKKNNDRKGRRRAKDGPGNVWARPGMNVTFRAELMPGRDRTDRTFRVKELLSSGRVVLHEVAGEHAEREFEPHR